MASAQAVRIVGRHQQAGAADHLRQRRRAGRHHRQPGGHGLQHRRAEPLVAAREGQDVGQRVDAVAVALGDPARSDHPAVEAELRHLLEQRRLRRTATTEQHQLHVVVAGAEPGQGPHQHDVVLVGVGDGGVDDDAAGEAEAAPELRFGAGAPNASLDWSLD